MDRLTSQARTNDFIQPGDDCDGLDTTSDNNPHYFIDDTSDDDDSNIDPTQFVQVTFEAVGTQRKILDARNRRDRVLRSNLAWEALYVDLTAAFLSFDMSGAPPSRKEGEPTHDSILVVDMNGEHFTIYLVFLSLK